MNRRRWVIIGIIALAVVAVISLRVGSRVPTYQGKSVYDWMFAQKSSALESSPGLMAIGSNAVPYLAGVLRIDQTRYDRYEWVRSRAFQKFAERWNLGFTWRKPAIQVRRSAAFSLLAFSFESVSALPEIHHELLRAKDTDRQTVVHCLSEMGPLPESIPWLVMAFPLTTNETWVVRHDLLHALGGGGTNAAALAMTAVLVSLKDRQSEVRSMAAQTLGRWAQPAPAAIPDLLSMLNGTNDYGAMSAASALGKITNRCDEALPGVRRLLENTNDYTRAVAAMTLWRLGGEAESTRRKLQSLLRSKGAKGVAARSLGQMGPAARESVPELLKAAQETIGTWVEMYDRAQCAKAVLLIQGESPEACAVLEESITTEKNGWVRETMVGEIAQLGPLARPLLPALRQALNDSHRGVRHEAAQAVEGLKDLR
jgi:HEAT repeat protein